MSQSTGAERALRIKAALEGFNRSMAKVENRVIDGSAHALNLWASGTIMQVIAKSISGRPGLINRTGTLMRALKHRESGTTMGDLATQFFVGDAKAHYAFIHEFGGTVRSRRPGGYLAIPLPGSPGTGPTGASLYNSPLRTSLPPGFFVIKTGKGNLLLGHEVNGEFEAWFKLVRQVKIPKRLHFRDTVKASIVNLQAQLRKNLKAVTSG